MSRGQNVTKFTILNSNSQGPATAPEQQSSFQKCNSKVNTTIYFESKLGRKQRLPERAMPK